MTSQLSHNFQASHAVHEVDAITTANFKSLVKFFEGLWSTSRNLFEFLQHAQPSQIKLGWCPEKVWKGCSLQGDSFPLR